MSFQENSSPFFVESDEFSGEQMTGPEKPLFFVYAAQVLEVLSSETELLSLQSGRNIFAIMSNDELKLGKKYLFS